MNKRYAGLWALLAVGTLALGLWVVFGRTYVRRRFYAAEPLDGASRTESRFVAVLLPRVSLRPHRYAMSRAELSEFLGALKADGYTAVGLSDVAQLYGDRRRLPPKAVLVAFAQDDSQGMETADAVLRDLRWRGAAFITRTALRGGKDERRFLTPHAVGEMGAGGGWEFGRAEGATLSSASGFLRFTPSELGYNDASDDPGTLRVLAIRPDRAAAENARIVENSWPRTALFSDDFRADGLRADWVAAWGVVSMRNRRMAILPTPRQTGAGVFIRGTERWRDQTLELELERFRREFWAYARYKDDDRYVRVGVRDGFWFVEQKTGPGTLPHLLARSPVLEGAFPARIRLVLKGGAAIVHVNGRMQFGKALRVHGSVDQGRVLLGVYDARSPSALGVVTAVRAEPLREEWLAPRGEDLGTLDDDRLEGLREEAIRAGAVSPSWVRVAADGAVSVAETQGLLIRSLAGFYGCRLVPTVRFAALHPGTLGSPTGQDKLVGDLAEAASALGVAGLNLRMGLGEEPAPEALAFLTKLHEAFRLHRRQLVVTLEGPRGGGGALSRAVDGLLRPSERSRPGFELLQAVAR